MSARSTVTGVVLNAAWLCPIAVHMSSFHATTPVLVVFGIQWMCGKYSDPSITSWFGWNVIHISFMVDGSKE